MEVMAEKIQYVKKHPKLKFERHGDLYDLQFLGVDKVSRYTVYDGVPSWNFDEEFGTLSYEKGDIFRVKLGFSMKLPEGKMAKVHPRSSTRKNFNVILTNSEGQIDNSYNGTDDEWLAEFVAIDDGWMTIGDRILQFEITDVQPQWEFEEVDELSKTNRGGFGSTNVK